jgi:hypothetical protein
MPAVPSSHTAGPLSLSGEAVGRRTRPIYRVFVSSTWLDLQPERRALMEALNRMEEMRFVGMEFFGNRPDDTHDASIDQVDLCEVFVGIIGHRYGSGITEAEYRRARALNLPCFVYFKGGEAASSALTDNDPALAAKLAAFKQELRRGHTVKEVGSPEELAASATADLHNWVAARWISLESIVTSVRPPAPDADRTNILRLLERIEQDWIKGVLEVSLHRRAWMDLGLDWQDEAVEQPWDRILIAPDRPVQTLGERETIGGVFSAAQNTLLILGEPGAGKTTTLLELLRGLVGEAREAAAEPAPVVLALSTWTGRHRSLGSWLLEEMNLRYQIPKKLAQGWLDGGRLMLLLDGLDEVRESLRSACVSAINAFALEHMPAGLAVTCRVAEYSALKERLRLRSAICLQPLTPAQIDAYFERAGAGLENLRTAMREDETLRSLAQTPLMLSVMTMAWRGVSPSELPANAVVPTESRRQQLFDAYIQAALRRKGARADEASGRETLAVLSWLAAQMRQRGQTLFAVEQLQPDWLDGATRQFTYFLWSRTLATMVLTLPYLLLAGASWKVKTCLIAVAAGLGIGLAVFDYVFFCWVPVRFATPWHRILAFACIFGIAPITALPVLQQVAGDWLPGNIFPAMVGYIPLVIASLSTLTDVKLRDIRPADAIGWSWAHSWRRAAFSLVVWQWFLIIGLLEGMIWKDVGFTVGTMGFGSVEFRIGLLLGALLAGGLGWRYRWRGWVALARAGAICLLAGELGQLMADRGTKELLIGTLFLFALTGIFGGVTSGIDETRARRTGAWFWIKVPLLAALAVGSAVGAIFAGIGMFSSGREQFFMVAAICAALGGIVGLVAFFRFGGFQGTQHYILRRQLVRSGRLPARPTELLNAAVRLNLLQKVGFGYRFIHALLLDHFAALRPGLDSAEKPVRKD